MGSPQVKPELLSLVAGNVDRSIATKQKLKEDLSAVVEGGVMIASAMREDRKLLLAGNGGSASDAQHIATEFVVRYKASNVRRALPALSLATDTSCLTAGGNDIGFDNIFARQIEALGREGDVFLGISTSGNSSNILAALKVARVSGLKTILYTGDTGGKIMAEHADLVDVAVLIPSAETSRIQECHIMVGQIMCAVVEKELFDLD